MKTYTFKIKIDTDKIVCAVNMQLEQFYDSIKLTKAHFNELLARYPHCYITATDYYDGDNFIDDDYVVSRLDILLKSKDLKSYLIDKEFIGFVGDDSFDEDYADNCEAEAANFIKSLEDDEEEEEDSAELSETKQE